MILTLVLADASVAQVPPDFALSAEAGPRLPGRAVRRAEVGTTDAVLSVVAPQDRATGRATTSSVVALSPAQVQCLYDAVVASGFFTAAAPTPADVRDGTYARLAITASGETRTIETRNAAFAPVDDVVRRLNSLTFPPFRLDYNAIAGLANAPPCP